MADTKTSALPAATAALGADEIPINEAGTSKKLTITLLASYILAAGLYAPGSLTIPTGQFMIMTSGLQLTSTQRLTLQGTASLRIT